MNYVIIGDVHGMLEPLEQLLKKLGFSKQHGVYQHPEYIAVFVGDLVDRGKDQRGVLELVRAMMEYGSAKAVLGNHEFYVISFYTINPSTQRPFIEHTPKLLEYRQAFMADYPIGSDDADDIINWLKSLPLFLDLDDFRVVHATWDNERIDQLKSYTNQHGQLLENAWHEGLTHGSALNKAIRVLLEGASINTPVNPKKIPQGETNVIPYLMPPSVKAYRVRWWKTFFSTWKQILCKERDFPDFENIPLPIDNPLKSYHYSHDHPPRLSNSPSNSY